MATIITTTRHPILQRGAVSVQTTNNTELPPSAVHGAASVLNGEGLEFETLRAELSDEAKQKIVSNVVSALSDFVEIESQDKVQLSVSTDLDLGTIYSVTVPVHRVRSEYLVENEIGAITNIEYKTTGETSDSVDVKFDFYIPSEATWRPPEKTNVFLVWFGIFIFLLSFLSTC
ncbi:unnamed protein product [Fraxinus pennsylvanica]|uniref:Uncharacterized protein n=1 Tax=Fraxinus pennsylvanica TaxID=56036 RepID=A0AAD1YTV7_9LAMI|nr:unnamed protein product [Fraxinus pennsylvanica]